MHKVKYEEMLPHEFLEALRQFPVAYVPVGSLEWHGRHMALGNDSLKAYGILLKAAEKYGGIVVPPTYWGHMQMYDKPCSHPGIPPEVVDGLFKAIFQGLVVTGFKVVIGVTGHDVDEQLESLQKAADSISADGKAVGFAMKEGDLYDLGGEIMDHAGYWETSILMYLRPELLDLDRIRDEDLSTEAGHRAAGILGRDPRTDASVELGAIFVKRMADNIGKKAQELLLKVKDQQLSTTNE
jgi:creatinine amidohydrolase